MEKVEGTERINGVLNACLNTKHMHGNRVFLNISRLLEITKRERNELFLLVKNLQELGSSPFPYIAPVILRPLPGEVVRGEHFILIDLLKSIPGSSYKERSAREPQVEIVEGALVSFVRLDQSPLRNMTLSLPPRW